MGKYQNNGTAREHTRPQPEEMVEAPKFQFIITEQGMADAEAVINARRNREETAKYGYILTHEERAARATADQLLFETRQRETQELDDRWEREERERLQAEAASLISNFATVRNDEQSVAAILDETYDALYINDDDMDEVATALSATEILHSNGYHIESRPPRTRKELYAYADQGEQMPMRPPREPRRGADIAHEVARRYMTAAQRKQLRHLETAILALARAENDAHDDPAASAWDRDNASQTYGNIKGSVWDVERRLEAEALRSIGLQFLP